MIEARPPSQSAESFPLPAVGKRPARMILPRCSIGKSTDQQARLHN